MNVGVVEIETRLRYPDPMAADVPCLVEPFVQV